MAYPEKNLNNFETSINCLQIGSCIKFKKVCSSHYFYYMDKTLKATIYKIMLKQKIM